MTYHLGTNPPAAPPASEDSTPEGSAWYKVTPTVLAWLGATYPNDAAMRAQVIERVARELVFIGIPPGGDEMFFLSAGSTGSFGRSSTVASPYAAPPGAPRMAYRQVLDVFEIRGGGPTFKRRAPAAKTNWGLYLGIGAVVAALLGLGVLAIRRRGGGELTQNRSTVYAIPERRAYPITSAKDAYHATQRLKQGRVTSVAVARKIIQAIRSRFPEIAADYLADVDPQRIEKIHKKSVAARKKSSRAGKSSRRR